MKRWRRIARQLMVEERGQDLIEYALLTAIIGVVGWLAFPSIHAKMQSSFQSWGADVHSIWVPSDPQ